jgi:hypothetical protein
MAQVDSENSTAVPIKPTAEANESPADALYLPTDVTPEEIFQAIGRLRKEARDAIDELIRFLDKTDDYVSRELEDDAGSNPEEDSDAEPSLGSFDGLVNQAKSWAVGGDDAELDGCDDEPSLGSHELREGGAVSYLPSERGGHLDVEGEHDGREPEFCGLTADRACHASSLEAL